MLRNQLLTSRIPHLRLPLLLPSMMMTHMKVPIITQIRSLTLLTGYKLIHNHLRDSPPITLLTIRNMFLMKRIDQTVHALSPRRAVLASLLGFLSEVSPSLQ